MPPRLDVLDRRTIRTLSEPHYMLWCFHLISLFFDYW